jgi:hypothetical protein
MNIEINDRTLQAYQEEFTKRGIGITKQDYDQEEFYLVNTLKQFDKIVDPTKGISKVVQSIIRQPVTIFNDKGVPEVKDALYYYGQYIGYDKTGNKIYANFQEGYY